MPDSLRHTEHDSTTDLRPRARSFGGRGTVDSFRLSFGQIGALAAIFAIGALLIGPIMTFAKLSQSVETLARVVDKMDGNVTASRRDVSDLRDAFVLWRAESNARMTALEHERAGPSSGRSVP